jgi:hypothetical protein
MSDGRFNGIAILDAIPTGELNTARRLHEDLKDIANYIAAGLEVRYFRIDTLEDLESGISQLLREATDSGLKPWLHIEGHGLVDERGFSTANTFHCTWTRLRELITPLNVATDFNVVLVLATCFGGSFARAITTVDRAPVLGLIGPTREITIGEVEIDFPAFYQTFFKTASLKEAIAALSARAQSNLYYRTTAEQFFYDVWASYKRNACSERQIDERARRMYRQAKSQNLPRTPGIGQLRRRLRSEEKRLFEKYRDRYFMYDINTSNRTRFPVTYKEAEIYVSGRGHG